jgi:hypothetical protein
MPSGGWTSDYSRRTMLIQMLEYAQSAQSEHELESLLNGVLFPLDLITTHTAAQSDYSLIVNTATANGVRSYEYSATNGSEVVVADKHTAFVSTNMYLSDAWGSRAHTPRDDECWDGVTR